MSTGQGRNVNHRTAIALSAALVAAAGLTACGGSAKSESRPAAPAGAGSPSAEQEPSKAIADAEARLGIPPKPDAATQARYVAALDAISRDIVNGKPERAVSRGRSTCGTIHSFPKDHAKQVEQTRQRFSGATQFNAAQAEKILEAVHTHLCPKN
ncbi:hypothetical protein ACH4GF_40775 [Streptomyces rimosus]|uniref:DUF732 domain-containing protein n=1 Tax=Streptomyces rimosus subsp. rimosus TaxID=132474 RepID=A0ABY3Z0K9_STRRM|nr:hypothetical protein [Streptomyces rimosus]KOT30954.1 hypothetical protein ADK84_31415 [Streptomyces sp. NRRL WC-3701]KOU00369.1 hypothetical protein ADK70_00545 [Streptomyces rimosus subsp. pseudoverticillatus]KOT31581.1 hypothetical protein ADK42_27705 [Streptomyces rimosus subsp. rimosus]KOT50552.1 hypothetical protein ADK44_35220 [Streptomyces rimosus subsp. rimosus]KOT65249.1 hypothetical protein ADK45_12340 [Streptomyces rimosus subsp. rimosus]